MKRNDPLGKTPVMLKDLPALVHDAARWAVAREQLCIGDAPVTYVSGKEADDYVDNILRERAKKGKTK